MRDFTFSLQIHYITGRLNTYGTIHRYNLHLQCIYRQITIQIHLQDALIHTRTQLTFTIQIQYITGRLNTYGTIHRYNLHLQCIYRQIAIQIHLQDTLIHTVLYVAQLSFFFTIQIQYIIKRLNTYVTLYFLYTY